MLQWYRCRHEIESLLVEKDDNLHLLSERFRHGSICFSSNCIKLNGYDLKVEWNGACRIPREALLSYKAKSTHKQNNFRSQHIPQFQWQIARDLQYCSNHFISNCALLFPTRFYVCLKVSNLNFGAYWYAWILLQERERDCSGSSYMRLCECLRDRAWWHIANCFSIAGTVE